MQFTKSQRVRLWAIGAVSVACSCGACTEGAPQHPSLRESGGFDGPTPALEKQSPSPDRPMFEHPRAVSSGTHFPNRAEVESCGAIVQRVTRRAPAFASLVRNESAALVFKDEEATGADRMMAPALKARLEGLATLLAREWPGLRLRVTEAWDEDGEHGENSLHYEGRAADVTASDRDAQRLPRLGGLALEAGFDWVSNEGSHVHVSVRR
ncbi:MAG TPA: hypothetical protein VFQ61_00425 [Polyangiaceae bacterium]|nr:hypothetical protein [Polyangiaceae bacterium]